LNDIATENSMKKDASREQHEEHRAEDREGLGEIDSR